MTFLMTLHSVGRLLFCASVVCSTVETNKHPGCPSALWDHPERVHADFREPQIRGAVHLLRRQPPPPGTAAAASAPQQPPSPSPSSALCRELPSTRTVEDSDWLVAELHARGVMPIRVRGLFNSGSNYACVVARGWFAACRLDRTIGGAKGVVVQI